MAVDIAKTNVKTNKHLVLIHGYSLKPCNLAALKLRKLQP